MAGKVKYVILLTIPILLFFIGFYHAEELSFLNKFTSSTGKIEYKGYFPDPEVPIATAALGKVKVHPFENLVAVIEQRPSKVYLFKKDGTYIDEVGAKGRGPDEYSMANSVALMNEEIVLNDVGNGKIIAFDQKKQELYSFSPDFIPANMLLTKKEILLFPYYNQVKEHEAYLYTSYTSAGVKTGEYGEIPDRLRKLSDFPQLNVDIFDEEIYMLPFPSPRIYRYGIKEHIYEPVELKGRNYSTIMEKLENAFPEVEEERRTIFADMKITEDGIFVSVFHVGLIIDHYDSDGTYIQTFNFEEAYEDEELKSVSSVDRYIRSFDMIKLDNGRYRLYGAVSSSYARILMFDVQL